VTFVLLRFEIVVDRQYLGYRGLSDLVRLIDLLPSTARWVREEG
jgi:hypothetical protein